MASCPILEVPSELLVHFAELLQPWDIKNFASSCKSFYPLLINELYCDDIKSGRCRALSWACQFGVLPTLERSLKLGAPINYSFRQWNYATCEYEPRVFIRVRKYVRVAYHEDLHEVACPEDLCGGLSPLLVAALNNHLEIVCYLLKNGADPDIASVDHNGLEKPTLQWLLDILLDGRDEPKEQRCDVLEALLKAGANPNVQGGHYGKSLLERSLCRTYGYSECPIEATRLLLEHGATVSLDEVSQEPNVLICLIHDEVVARRLDHLFVRKLDLVLGHCPGVLNGTSWEEIMQRILSCPSPIALELLKIALAHGCSCDSAVIDQDMTRTLRIRPIQRISGQICISTRAKLGTDHKYAVEILRELLEAGADPNRWEKDHGPGDCSALYLLATRFNKSYEPHEHVITAARLLLEKGANANVVGDTGCTVLHKACWVDVEDKRLIRLLLQFGADVNALDDSGDTVLSRACREPVISIDLIQLFLQYGATTSDEITSIKDRASRDGWTMRDKELLNLLSGNRIRSDRGDLKGDMKGA